MLIQHWPYLGIACFLILLILALRPCRRRIRDGMLASARGDFAAARDAYLWLVHSRSPGARLYRWLKPGQSELNVAVAMASLGEHSDALEWCHRALKRARLPAVIAYCHKVAAIVHAHQGDELGLQEHLAALRDLVARGSQPADFYYADAVSRYHELGRLDQSIHWMGEAITSLRHPASPALYNNILELLVSLGQFDAVLELTAPLLAPLDARTDVMAGPETLAVKDCLRRGFRAESLLFGCEAAYQTGKPDRQAAFAAAAQSVAGELPAHRARALGQEMCVAAARGDREEVARLLEALDQVVGAYPDNRYIAANRSRDLAFAYLLLGEPEAAIAEYQKALQGPLAHVHRSHIHARIAECLDELGRHDEAARHRQHARSLAPLAFWNHAGAAPPIPANYVSECVRRLRESADGVPTVSAMDALPPVASKLACASWMLAVLAMLPVVGAIFALPLGGISGVSLLRRRKLPHDRKVAFAGLTLAVLSLTFAAIIVLNVLNARRAAVDTASDEDLVAQVAAATRAAAEAAESDKDQLDDAISLADEHTTTSEPAEWADFSATVDEDAHLDEAGEPEPAGTGIYTTQLPINLQRIGLFVVLIISIMLHEIAHAVAAYWAGDPTARDLGRFSLHPFRHLDLTGSIIVPGILAFTGSPIIGWAKPVPISPHRFRHERRGNLGVSLAGVSINLLLAMLAANLIALLLIGLRWHCPEFMVEGRLFLFDWRLVGLDDPAPFAAILQLLMFFVFLNAVLAGFNLLPFPPLDGFNALRALLPGPLSRLATRFSGTGMIILILLIAMDWLQGLLIPGVLFTMTLLAFVQGLAGV
ncbi:MAG TPA: hypothetical protein PLQ89_17445 [Phycisphaerae bacterium]|nr:hypothetical protein [Phycisphaerae bacterium]HPU27710.1 hypothetical protein [Phycisphaerae bacterium]